MESLVKCAKCGKKPRTLGANERKEFGATAGVTAETGGYSPSSALKQQSKNSPKNQSPRAATEKKSGSKKATIFDKLTDPKLYTGTHVHRFDEKGKGKGLNGRDAASGIEYGSGKVNDISQILRPPSKSATKPLAAYQVSTTHNEKGAAKAGIVSPKKKKDGSSIFDKLTDPKLYTGAHKLRFDTNGKGRGMSGRDAASGIDYGSGKVNDISQIVRSNLR